MKKPVASVLRVIGAGLMLLSVVLLALLWIAHKSAPEPWWRWALYSLPAVTGIVVVACSGKLATAFTRNFEE